MINIFILSLIILNFFNGTHKILGKPIWFEPKRLINYETDGEATSQQIFDIYTFSHISHGIILYLILDYFKFNNKIITGIIIELLWEIFENTPFIINKYRKSFRNYKGDSIVNIIGDTIACLLGLYITSYNKKVSLYLFLFLEIILLPFNSNLLYLSFGSLLK